MSQPTPVPAYPSRWDFAVIVTAITESGNPAGIGVFTEMHDSHDAAKVALRALMVKMGKAIAAADGPIIDAEVDDL